MTMMRAMCSITSQDYISGLRASRVVGVPYRTLDNWIRSGVLPQPTIPAQGKGTKRGFSFADLVRANAVRHLREKGIQGHIIRKAMDELTERYRVTDPLTDTARLLVAGERVFWAMDDKTLLEVLTGQLAAKPLVLVDLAEIVSQTKESLETLHGAA